MESDEIGMEHPQYILHAEDSAQSLILSQEAQAHQTIPLGEVNWWRRILRLDSDHTTLYLGRWLETIASNLDQVVNARKELDVNAESTVHIGAWFGYQPLSKFSLEHEYRTSEHRPVLQQFKDKRRRNLVWRVCNTNIEKWHLRFDSISLNQTKFMTITQFINTL